MIAGCASENELFPTFGRSRRGTFCSGTHSEIVKQLCRRTQGKIDHKLRVANACPKGSLAWNWRRGKHFDAK
jgi:hypothetical protein